MSSVSKTYAICLRYARHTLYVLETQDISICLRMQDIKLMSWMQDIFTLWVDRTNMLVNQMPDEMQVILHADQILDISDAGSQVFD